MAGPGADHKYLHRLAALIRDHRDDLLAQWRKHVRALPSARQLDAPTLNDHIPELLDELANALEAHTAETIADGVVDESAPAHGIDRFENGFDIVEVVAEYNILRGCVHSLGERHGVRFRGRVFQIMNRVFDDAIGMAVRTFAAQQALELQRRREEYVAFLAHDIRTPLHAISTATEVLDRSQEPAGEPRRHEMLRVLQRNVGHLRTLIDNILRENSSAAKDHVKLEKREVELAPLVDGLIYDLHAIAEAAGTRVDNETPAGLIVFADASLVRRILQNLTANAISNTLRGAVAIGARVEGDVVEIFVRDNGVGIAPERLQGIFERSATSSQGSPSGFGLSIVKSLVEAHGGHVSAQSEEHVGSTFRFTLPRKP